MQESQHQQTGLQPWQQGLIFLLACAVIVSRRPDALFHAQFWNEDGHVFFADAYNFGWWSALFRCYEGYFHACPRLGAALALLVPLSLAPLVLNLIAIGIQALPANLLLSSRSSAWGSLRFRTLLAVTYLALPNCWEIDANITNSQWLLALNAFLLLAAFTPRSAAGRFFDLCILLLCGLTGPLCILLFPIAAILVWRYRDRWRWVEAGILAAACLVQAWSLFNGGFSSRPHYPLGASPAMFARILAGQVYLGTLLGSNALAAHPGLGRLIVFTCIAASGTIFVAICFLRSPLQMRLFLLFSSMIMVALLIAPTPGPLNGVTVWEVLVGGGAARYWFFPTLAFAWSILWCFQSRTLVLKTVSAALLCVMCFGVALRWRHPAFQDAHFAEYARSFESAPEGMAVTIPESTPGWNLRLVKHRSSR
jgi:hypothetical protein